MRLALEFKGRGGGLERKVRAALSSTIYAAPFPNPFVIPPVSGGSLSANFPLSLSLLFFFLRSLRAPSARLFAAPSPLSLSLSLYLSIYLFNYLSLISCLFSLSLIIYLSNYLSFFRFLSLVSLFLSIHLSI